MACNLVIGIPDQQMLTVAGTHPVGGNRGRDNRHSRIHGFEGFVLQAGPFDHWKYEHIRPSNIRPDIIDCAGDSDPGPRELTYRGCGITSDDQQCGIPQPAQDPREYALRQAQRGGNVGLVRHVTRNPMILPDGSALATGGASS